MNLLVLLAIILLIVAGHQLLKVIELSRGLKKTKEWQISDADNNLMGKAMLWFMVVFFAFFFWQVNRWMDRSLPPAASEHGVKVDLLWDANIYLITFVFLVTNFFLFWFAYKYRGNSKAKAEFIAHNNKLELLWTVVPAIALAFVIIFGLKYWNEIMAPSNEENKIIVELYAKQFDWTARYPGKDNVLGETDYRQINGSNPVGMDTSDVKGKDDILVRNEFHIPVGTEIELRMRSRDVIHSAYLPHFRAQMNCVPGMITYFKFKPTKTTAEMRKDPYVIKMMAGINAQRAKENKEPVEFDYLLLCNKICGASHYNMQMNVIVESLADFKLWRAQKAASKTVASN
ncbi:MAG: cytochrome c oxidase subunit II [Bacteroidia bacterium]|jgi:cytochrome c oxidase subunit 2|nr:cytochrome c oxidase subunit II [Bacteroidia bacterium]